MRAKKKWKTASPWKPIRIFNLLFIAFYAKANNTKRKLARGGKNFSFL